MLKGYDYIEFSVSETKPFSKINANTKHTILPEAKP